MVHSRLSHTISVQVKSRSPCLFPRFRLEFLFRKQLRENNTQTNLQNSSLRPQFSTVYRLRGVKHLHHVACVPHLSRWHSDCVFQIQKIGLYILPSLTRTPTLSASGSKKLESGNTCQFIHPIHLPVYSFWPVYLITAGVPIQEISVVCF